jgi:hypothetical protein
VGLKMSERSAVMKTNISVNVDNQLQKLERISRPLFYLDQK